MIALLKLLPFNILIGKGLHHPDTGQRILQAGVHISDLAPVLHESLLHPLVLPQRKEKHTENQNNKRQSQPPVDEEQENKGTDDLHQ